MARPLRRCVFPALTLVLLPALGFVAPGRAGAVPDSTGVTTRVSVKSGGGQADATGPAVAGQPAVSDNGAVVAFVSDATNLVPDDHNGVADVFVVQGGTIKRVSVGSLGPNYAEADGPSSSPALSTDGRFVAFASAADNLVPGDTNDAVDVFVYDRQQSTVSRVSVAADGTQADGDSRSPSMDDTGAVVAFTSAATNLVAGDGNGKTDVFVRTLGSTPATTLVSLATGGSAPGDDASDEPSLNGNGTQIAFSSDATDLVAGDTNGKSDVFWRDLATTTTQRVSLRTGSTTTQGNGDSFSPSLSGDGTLIAFASDAKNLSSISDGNDATDVFLRDRTDKSTDLLSRCNATVGDQQSLAPRISSDTSAGNASAGVTFASDAENLVGAGCSQPSEPDDDNHVTDVYFRPLRGAPVQNERMSRDVAGAQFTRPSLEAAPSGDGRFVAFSVGSPAADVFGRDRGASPGVTKLLSAPADGPALGPAVTEFPVLSGDGRTVAFVSAAADLVTDDQNGFPDVFVHDRAGSQTSRVSLGVGGAQPNGPSGTDSPPALSADGQIVAFSSAAANLVTGDNNNAGDVFVYDRGRKETTRVSVGPGGVEATGGESYSPALSADGRYVAFASDATNLVGADDSNSATDVFVYDRQAKTTTRVSLGPGGAQGDGISYNPTMSADGALVAFTSAATNLVAGPENSVAGNDSENVFLRDVKAGTTTRVSTGSGSGSGGSSSPPSLSADGRYVAYASAAATLVPGDLNNASDVFVFDRTAGTTERVSIGTGGSEGNRASDGPAISGDGRFVAFGSDATNLIPGDTNQRTDVFVRDRRLGTTTRVSVAEPFVFDETLGRNRPGPPRQGDRPSTLPSISGNGRFVAFQSAATNLAEITDTNAAPDIFVHDRTPAVGYRLVAGDGGVFTYGRVPFFGSTGSIKLARPIVGLASAPTGQGYWLVASDGGVFALGAAGFFGSTGATKLARPIVGMAATPTGLGYWLVASDGGVFAFGDAGFFGSTGKIKLAQPIVGMAATPTGKGYWLVARDGGIFAFGDAPFAGSTGAIRLAQPVVGMAAAPAGGGYWLVASDGGIFAFGDAAFFGSTGALKLNRPIVGMAATPSGGGYWAVASDGGIFAFGDAPFVGSAGATKLVQPVVGMAGRV
jgi:Tol biopolymer transport system component